MVHPLISESGGHRWQRIPPTERKGRVHTSTVTVAVLGYDEQGTGDRVIRTGDVQEFTQRGTGPGGQHRNKTESAVTLVHIPTGIRVRIDTRSQHQSRAEAWRILKERVCKHYTGACLTRINEERKAKVGSGMRGDKIRTYREQDGTVIHHASQQKYRLQDVLKGKLQFGNSR